MAGRSRAEKEPERVSKNSSDAREGREGVNGVVLAVSESFDTVLSHRLELELEPAGWSRKTEEGH